jgi:hypothetical protein
MFQMVALERTLFVEGKSRDRSVGEFRGIVLALGWYPDADEAPRSKWSSTTPSEVHYLVSDRRKPAPVWVAAADLSKQDWISASAPDSAAPHVAAVPAPRIAAAAR